MAPLRWPTVWFSRETQALSCSRNKDCVHVPPFQLRSDACFLILAVLGSLGLFLGKHGVFPYVCETRKKVEVKREDASWCSYSQGEAGDD